MYVLYVLSRGGLSNYENPAQEKYEEKNRKQGGSAGKTSCKSHLILSQLENRRERSFFMGRQGWWDLNGSSGDPVVVIAKVPSTARDIPFFIVEMEIIFSQ